MPRRVAMPGAFMMTSSLQARSSPTVKPRHPCGPMRRLALLLLLAGAGALAAAGDPGSPADAPHPDIRRQILLEYKYAGPPGDSARSAPSAPAAAAAPGEPAPGPVGPLEARAATRTDALRATFQRQEADAHRARMASRLGIGVHEAPFGPGGFYAVTVFYIPVAVGFAISF